MANTGHEWGAWAFAKDDGGTDWDMDALADNATETSNTSISLNKKSACEVAVAMSESNIGAIDGVVTVYVLGSGVADEETTVGSPWSFAITPVQNDIVYKPFAVDPSQYGSFTPAVKNESGQALNISVKYRTADIPLAS